MNINASNTNSVNKWDVMRANNPGHSQWYAQRFKNMEAQGADLVGEARLLDAMLARGSKVLDAGCGPGRHAGYLHRAGHTVVGYDLDEYLISVAKAEHPGPTWLVGDLVDLDIRLSDLVPAGSQNTDAAAAAATSHPDPQGDVEGQNDRQNSELPGDDKKEDGPDKDGPESRVRFDAILCAGNVMTFVAPDSRRKILRRFAQHLADQGRVIIGFGANRGYPFDEFLEDASASGLTDDFTYSTWDLRPLSADSDFMVAILSHH